MTHFQVTIQLPLRYNSIEINTQRKKIEEYKFKETYNELLSIVGGITINPNPFQGTWIDPTTSVRYDDENIVWSMLVDSEDKVSAVKVAKIQELIKYKEVLKERFQQENVYIVAVRCSWL